MLLEYPLGPEYTGVVGVDSVQDTVTRAPAAPAFGDAIASGLASSHTVAMADIYLEAAPNLPSELSPILIPGEILAVAFGPRSNKGRDDFFF